MKWINISVTKRLFFELQMTLSNCYLFHIVLYVNSITTVAIMFIIQNCSSVVGDDYVVNLLLVHYPTYLTLSFSSIRIFSDLSTDLLLTSY